jgi:outer membrane lipoprotein carrier protein
MRSRRLALVAVLLLCLAGGKADLVAEILEKLQSRYEAIQDIQGEFTQTSLVASLGREDVSSGNVIVQRPGRMLWKYEEPEARVVLLDRETVQIYTPEDGQLQIVPIAAGAVSPTALGFLLGGAVLRDAFRASRITELGREEIGLKLIPREDAGFEYLELWLEPSSYQLRESVIMDLFGNRTRVRFHGVRENVGVGEEVFSITVPEDTEVIDLR